MASKDIINDVQGETLDEIIRVLEFQREKFGGKATLQFSSDMYGEYSCDIESPEPSPVIEYKGVKTDENGTKWRVDKVTGTTVDLETLEDNQHVGVGDGKTYHLRYTLIGKATS